MWKHSNPIIFHSTQPYSTKTRILAHLLSSWSKRFLKLLNYFVSSTKEMPNTFSLNKNIYKNTAKFWPKQTPYLRKRVPEYRHNKSTIETLQNDYTISPAERNGWPFTQLKWSAHPPWELRALEKMRFKSSWRDATSEWRRKSCSEVKGGERVKSLEDASAGSQSASQREEEHSWHSWRVR